MARTIGFPSAMDFPQEIQSLVILFLVGSETNFKDGEKPVCDIY